MEIMKIIGLIIVIIVSAYVLIIAFPSLFKKTHDYRKKSAQEIEAERKKREQYENYYRTGNRRYLYDPNFNGRN